MSTLEFVTDQRHNNRKQRAMTDTNKETWIMTDIAFQVVERVMDSKINDTGTFDKP